MSDESIGPLLNVALFCEKTLQEKDEVISLVRVVDRMTLKQWPLEPLTTAGGETIEPNIQVAFFLHFDSFNYAAEHEFMLGIEDPSGEEKRFATVPIKFEANKNGLNFRGELTLGIKRLGHYWLVAYLDSKAITRVPLEVTQSTLSVSKTSDVEKREHPPTS